MKPKLKWFLVVVLAGMLAGCASVKTRQVEVRYDAETGAKTTEITTIAKGTTFGEGAQSLAGLKAKQTEGTQGFELTGLNQEASTTNLVALVNAFAAILQNLPK